VFRVIAILAVICIHTAPFDPKSSPPGVANEVIFVLVNTFCRFAVPFFFLTAGYFSGNSLLKSKSDSFSLFKRYSKRLIIVFIVWSVIYAVMPDDFLWATLKLGLSKGLFQPAYERFLLTVSRYREEPIFFLMEGTKSHLWFLPSLMIAMGIITSFLVVRKEKYLMPFSIALYIMGLLMNTYVHTPIGIHLPFRFDGKDGPFVSTLFTAIGFWFSKRDKCFSTIPASLIAIAGYALSLIEITLIRRFLHGPSTQVFTIGTVPFGIGMFCFALSKPNLGESTIFPKLGSLTLGIYVSHILAWEMVWNFQRFFNIFLWQLIFPILIYLLALGITILLKKFPPTARIVS